MSPFIRALLGVALGSALVLLLHPMSRPYMLGLFPDTRPIESVERAMGRMLVRGGKGVDRPAEPKTNFDASLWMQLAAQRLLSDKPLTGEEVEVLLEIAKRASDKDPKARNAFWLQMQAVLLDQVGRGAEATEAWLQASKMDMWLDYQSERLLKSVEEPVGGPEGLMAWHLAWAYYQRNNSAPLVIRDYARKVISRSGTEDEKDLDLRVATMRNGALLRDFAKNVHAVHIGIEIVELASHSPSIARISEAKRRSQERSAFFDALRNAGMLEEEREAEDAFKENDSRSVIGEIPEAAQKARRLSVGSIGTSSLPSILLFLAALGALAKAIGDAVQRYGKAESGIRIWPLAAAGLILSLSVLTITLLPLAALAVLAGTLLLACSPKLERRFAPTHLSRGMTFAISALTLAFAVCVSAFLVGLSTQGQLLLPRALAMPADVFFGSRVALGMAALVVTIIFVTVPMWAFANRVGTPLVLGLALRQFGRLLLVGCLGGLVLLAPASIYADLELKRVLAELIQNEQTHRIIQFQ